MNTISLGEQEEISWGRQVLRVRHPAFREERSDFGPSGQHQWRQWICGLVLSARHLGLERGPGRGSRDVWLPGSDRAIQRGRERQCRFGILDACPVFRADLLPDRRTNAFRCPHFRCTNSTPSRKAPAFIRARHSTWTIRSCIRCRARRLSNCRPASAGYEQRQTTAKTGPGISMAASRSGTRSTRSASQCSAFAEADECWDSNTSRNLRTGRRSRDTRCRSSGSIGF